ncbi:MAG: sensory box sensor histidine kinase [Limisphaerales bacterium]|nr:MAG: sensory box sensor histidine kinase [Limisphaerales bacterium]KAG0507602.1 MAG: sensory box sensor histidine kinase [Limisphaerales bacterium]TXT48221.1 MAG: sensory box sensor histidine kinase [Limisphaerales bacterium]
MNSILIVDDDDRGQLTLEALLAGEGCQLRAVADGPAALASAAESPPDLVLLDVMMAGMDGFEVCRRLRADARLREVPVVMVTTLDDRESRLRGIEAGADDFISKPFDSAELRLRVRSILRLNRYRRLVGERERFEKIFQLSAEGIFIVDGGGVVKLANPAIERLIGFDAETHMVGRNLMEFIAPEQLEHCMTCFQRLITGTGEPVRIETWFRRAAGEAVAVEVNAGKFEWLGAPAAQVFVRDITERQALARKVVEAQEAERRFIARELHDEIGQHLTGLKLSVELAGQLPADALPARLAETRARVDELLAKVRGLSLDLRPQMLDELGLLPALELLFDRFTAQTRVRVDFKQVGLSERLAPEIETAAYRVVQEALINIARHAKVTKADVRLWLAGGALGIQVEDEGAGFDVEAAARRTHSCGLAGMRERLVLLGGSLRIDSAPGAGTCLVATLPLKSAPAS